LEKPELCPLDYCGAKHRVVVSDNVRYFSGSSGIFFNAVLFSKTLFHRKGAYSHKIQTQVTSLAFSPQDGAFLLAANRDKVSLFDFDLYRLRAKKDTMIEFAPELSFDLPGAENIFWRSGYFRLYQTSLISCFDAYFQSGCTIVA
jgi:hypothetical protein